MSAPTYRGNTIPIISLPPNWAETVSWSQKYQTIISEALDSTEERQGRAPRPLYSISYSTVGLTLEETSYLRRLLAGADDLPVGCPLWPMACKLTTASGFCSATLAVDDTTDCLFDVFRTYALLWEDFATWEVVILSSVDTNEIVLDRIPINIYSTEALVVPLAYGFVPRSDLSQMTDEHGQWSCAFEERFIPLTAPTATRPAAPSTLAGIIASETQIDLTWDDNSSDETRFEVLRSTITNLNYEIIGTTAPNTALFSDTDVSAGTWFYRVRAVNADGPSPCSNEITITIVDTAVCAINGADLFGTSFDCYAAQSYSTRMQTAGTGFDTVKISNGSIAFASFDSNDGRLLLGSGETWAAKLSIADGWTTLRLGIRMAFIDGGDSFSGTPQLRLGLLHSPTDGVANGPLTSACENYFGLYGVASTWARGTSPIVNFRAGGLRLLSRQGAAETQFLGSNMAHYCPASSEAVRNLLVLQFDRSGTDITFSSIWQDSSSFADIALDDILSVFAGSNFSVLKNQLNSIVGATLYTVLYPGTYAASEAVGGVLDSVCIGLTNCAVAVSDVILYVP